MLILHPGHISDALVARMKRQAARGSYDGRTVGGQLPEYVRRCMHYCPNTRAFMIFTRDAGMHSSGWWKNPDYERCLHLSLSFQVREQGTVWPLPQDHKTARRWCEALFGADVRQLWIEPPFSEAGRQRDVWHYRLFCNPGWEPIRPRGEVYSRGWTPAGWKSWSEIHGVRDQDGAFGAEMAVNPDPARP